MLAAVMAAACASKPGVVEMREAPTGLRDGEAIAIMLSTYRQSAGEDLVDEKVDPQAIERTFDSCLRQEMLKTRSGLRFVEPQALREAAFPGKKIEEIPTDAQAVLKDLTDGKQGGRADLAGLRYVILLNGSQWDTGPKSFFSGSGGGAVIAGGSDRILALYATVLDLLHRRVAGMLRADRKGGEGGGIAFVVIIPIPFYFSSNPEGAELCAELGQALVRFIVQQNPESR
ncbi:MAG TPA: hypothetical protein VD839_03835 [Burkholderiales bacterium]|nr:hypothetical protein [Burkholderiales bacterium]